MPIQTLLTKNGLVHQIGGLNWGSNSNNHTRILDAYIPIHASTINSNPGLIFPKNNLQNITIQWDDGFIMDALFEGTYTNNAGIIFPKQISSFPHKNSMGIYLRQRLGVIGNRPIVMNDLTNYGRTDVDITYLGGNNYLIDFHV